MSNYLSHMEQRLDVFTAIQRMEEMTKAGIPFNLEYYTIDGKFKKVVSALLRPGLSVKKNPRNKFLVAYTDHKNSEHRQFYRALLMKVNNVNIQP